MYVLYAVLHICRIQKLFIDQANISWHICCLHESLACISKTRVHGGQELFVKWQELFVKNISGISLSLRILGLTVLSRQGYMAGKNYLSSSKNYSSVFTNPCLTVLSRQGYMAGKNYLLKISLAYLGLYESLAFTVLSRQGYMEGKAYLSSSKNYLLKISLAYLCLYESLDCIIQTRVHGGQELFVKQQELFVKNISWHICVFTNPWPVLSRQGYMAGKNYLSSGKNYSLKISLALRILGLYYLDKGTWQARIICQAARTIREKYLWHICGFTNPWPVLSRQGYMVGKNYLSSGKNYLLKCKQLVYSNFSSSISMDPYKKVLL